MATALSDCATCGHSVEWHPRGRCEKFTTEPRGDGWCACVAFDVDDDVPTLKEELDDAAMRIFTQATRYDPDLEIDDYPAADSIIEEG